MYYVSAGTETEATGHFTLSERRGLVVKELESQTYNWRFEVNGSTA